MTAWLDRLLRREPAAPPPPASYVRQPVGRAAVERLSAGVLHVTWSVAARRVEIFAGDAPNAIDYSRPLCLVEGQQEVRVTEWGPAWRPFFDLHFHGGAEDGLTYLVSERALPLEGAVNFRDCGGYETESGKQVRWNRVFRSGLMANLTLADLEHLADLDIQFVCDFRAAAEVAARPDRLPEGGQLTYLHLPLRSATSTWRLLYQVFARRNRLGDLLLEGYTDVLLRENAELVGGVLTRLANPANLPLVLHCTAGKDRTGMLVALLLLLLGVPEETVVADYTLSNLHFAGYADTLATDIRRLTRLGFSEAQVQPLLVADARVITAALQHIHETYGSVEAYAREVAGVSAADLERLRQILLQ